MPIDVTCPGCRSRFQVSDKFAGKKGPCPKCKQVLTVPALSEQVKIHAPAPSGPTDKQGRPVLKPLARQETRLGRTQQIGIVTAVVGVLLMAVVLRFAYKPPKAKKPIPPAVPMIVLVLGATLLAPPLSLAGYSFLRDDELEPYTGRPLWIRVILSAVVYAVLWGVYAWVRMAFLGGQSPQTYEMLVVVPPFVLVGGFTALACFDLPFGGGVLHYGVYLVATILLRIIVGLPPL